MQLLPVYRLVGVHRLERTSAMNSKVPLLLGFAALLATVTSGNAVAAAPKRSEDNVKVTVKSEKSEKGKIVVTLTIEIVSGWHIYANPVGLKDLASSQTSVMFKQGDKRLDAKVEYPDGKLNKNEIIGDFKTYEGTVIIKATVDVPEAGAVEGEIFLRTANDRLCVVPSKVKIKVR